MSSQTLARVVGRQQPRVRTLPDTVVETRLDDVLDLCDLANLRNDPWQESTLADVVAVDRDGRWACTEYGVLVSRQQGKGNILLAYELAHLFLWPREDGQPKLIGHTAHENKTAREAFLRAKRTLLAAPSLRRQLKGGGRETSHGVSGISTGNGNWAIELENGNRLLFFTRTAGAGVGLSFDVLIVDEAQHTPLTIIEALAPTVNASPSPQILFTGTVPKEDQDGEYFEGLRDRGRRGGHARTGWVEFTPDQSDDPKASKLINLGDIEVWKQGAPGLGIRMELATLVDAWERLGQTKPEAFARQYLSIWPDLEQDASVTPNDLDLEVWGSPLQLAERGLSVDSQHPVVLAVALGRGGGYSSIAAAQRTPEGKILLQHLDTKEQSLWVAAELARYKKLYRARVVVDERNCSPILPDLNRANVRVLPMTMSEVAAAYDLFIEHVNAGDVVHPPQPEVDIAMRNAIPRVMSKVGNLRTWDQGDPTEPVTVVQAMTWALWGLKNVEGKPKQAAPAEAQVLTRDDSLGKGAAGGSLPKYDILTMGF